LNSPRSVKPICTKELAQATYAGTKELDNNKLVTLIAYLYPEQASEIVAKAHGALQDCYMVWLLLAKIVARLDFVTEWDELAEMWSGGTKTYKDMDKVVKLVDVMPFGKHKGVRLGDLPRSYIAWIGQQPDFNPSIVASLRSLRLL